MVFSVKLQFGKTLVSVQNKLALKNLLGRREHLWAGTAVIFDY